MWDFVCLSSGEVARRVVRLKRCAFLDGSSTNLQLLHDDTRRVGAAQFPVRLPKNWPTVVVRAVRRPFKWARTVKFLLDQIPLGNWLGKLGDQVFVDPMLYVFKRRTVHYRDVVAVLPDSVPWDDAFRRRWTSYVPVFSPDMDACVAPLYKELKSDCGCVAPVARVCEVCGWSLCNACLLGTRRPRPRVGWATVDYSCRRAPCGCYSAAYYGSVPGFTLGTASLQHPVRADDGSTFRFRGRPHVCVRHGRLSPKPSFVASDRYQDWLAVLKKQCQCFCRVERLDVLVESDSDDTSSDVEVEIGFNGALSSSSDEA